jgi:hypothetical protein
VKVGAPAANTPVEAMSSKQVTRYFIDVIFIPLFSFFILSEFVECLNSWGSLVAKFQPNRNYSANRRNTPTLRSKMVILLKHMCL